MRRRIEKDAVAALSSDGRTEQVKESSIPLVPDACVKGKQVIEEAWPDRSNPPCSMKCPRNRINGVLVGIILVFGVGESVCVADGEDLFAKNCALCHGKDGKAQTPIARKLGVKDLTQSKLTEAEIKKQIVEGKRDEHGKEKMPAFKAKLSEDEIKSIVTVVKDLRK